MMTPEEARLLPRGALLREGKNTFLVVVGKDGNGDPQLIVIEPGSVPVERTGTWWDIGAPIHSVKGWKRIKRIA
jgi:hypothetical protein